MIYLSYPPGGFEWYNGSVGFGLLRSDSIHGNPGEFYCYRPEAPTMFYKQDWWSAFVDAMEAMRVSST